MAGPAVGFAKASKATLVGVMVAAVGIGALLAWLLVGR
jgi:hypothetical protein